MLFGCFSEENIAVEHFDKGVVHFKLGNLKDAVKNFSNAIRINPDYKMAYYNRGLMYFKLAEFQLAINDYSNAIRISPDYPKAHNDLGKHQLAINDFTVVISLNRDNVAAYYYRGITKKKHLKLDYCADF